MPLLKWLCAYIEIHNKDFSQEEYTQCIESSLSVSLKMMISQLLFAIMFVFGQNRGDAEKVFDFSDDNDWKLDNESVFTHASLEKEGLPKSFTICSAFMVESWNEKTYAYLFTLLDAEQSSWLALSLWSSESETMLRIDLSGNVIQVTLPSFFFPLQWMNVCLSVDSGKSIVTLVVDSEVLLQKEMDMKDIPAKMDLVLGWNSDNEEYPGILTGLNIFSSALTLTRMKMVTEAGGELCSAPGDFLSWNDSVDRFEFEVLIIFDNIEYLIKSPRLERFRWQV